MKLLPAKELNPGDKTVVAPEEIMDEIGFTVHKFTPRKVPANKDNIVIFPNFSEFGSELVSSLYCLPDLLSSKYHGKYSIVMGWAGRAYLYKHLVDEFWEIKSEFQNLREYCRAFHHVSKNLRKAEQSAAKYGTVVNASNDYAHLCLQSRLICCQDDKCNRPLIYLNDCQKCIRCGRTYPKVGYYQEIQYSKKNLARWTPSPSKEKVDYVRNKYLKPKSVGITARFRQCYGRNLPVDFYEKLIIRLEEMGYNPIWIGEKETTLRSPFDRIIDYTITEDARDLETTLALVSQLEFTVQFWTASTRLAGLVGTPYLLFESPDQIWGGGQEGIRLNLCTKGEGKIVVSHYINVYNNQIQAIDLVERAIQEMQSGNFSNIIGMVENERAVLEMRKDNESRIGGNFSIPGG